MTRCRAAAAAVAALLLGACTAGDEPLAEPSVTPIPVPELSEPQGAATEPPLTEIPVPDGALPPSEAAPEVGAACDPEQRAAIDEAIDGQLSAFADDDWDGALDFATQGFRATRNAAQLEQIITEGFPIAADPASHATDDCRTDGTQAAIQVTVVSTGGEVGGFTYLVEREDDGVWRIAGAVPADASGGVA